MIEGESRAVYCGIACRYPVYPIDRPYPNGWLAGRPVRIVRLIDRGTCMFALKIIPSIRRGPLSPSLSLPIPPTCYYKQQ